MYFNLLIDLCLSSILMLHSSVFRQFMVRMLLWCSPFTGTIYQTDEPIFFQSIRNPFVFRCIDSVLIDGNDRAISKTVYRWAAAFRAHYEAQNTDTNQTSWLMNTDRVADGTDSAPSLWVTAPGWPLTPSTLSQWDSTSTTALTVSRFDYSLYHPQL